MALRCGGLYVTLFLELLSEHCLGDMFELKIVYELLLYNKTMFKTLLESI